MDAAAAVVADELVQMIMDELIQPLRAATAEPLLRLALATYMFLGRALQEPPWGALVARMARSDPRVGEFAQRGLREDVRQALAALPPAGLSLDVAAQAVLGIILQALAAIGDGALSEPDRSGIVRAILGAIGASGPAADAVLDRVDGCERRLRGARS